MAVQIPDPGTGNGQTGDNEYVFRKKVKDNFSDQTNAASRLVGPAVGQIPLYEQVSSAVGAVTTVNSPSGTGINLDNLEGGTYAYLGIGAENFPQGATTSLVKTEFIRGVEHTTLFLQNAYDRISGGRYFRTKSGSNWSTWHKDWHSGNATKDANGFLKAASPIVKVFADKVELNGEAVDQDVTYKKNGVGDYTITTVSGLSTDGWYIELPKDMNGNPKVAVTLTEVDGVISLKTYKRIFSMETFTFEPDLDNPLDIPDTRWIDLRLNEIPVEIEDDMKTEV